MDIRRHAWAIAASVGLLVVGCNTIVVFGRGKARIKNPELHEMNVNQGTGTNKATLINTETKL